LRDSQSPCGWRRRRGVLGNEIEEESSDHIMPGIGVLFKE
jgi:hypothetical protein